MSDSETIRKHDACVWSVADRLRDDCKESEYGNVVLQPEKYRSES